MFIAVYTAMPFLTNRTGWWRYHIGRMMVTKAFAIAGLMVISMVFYLTDIKLEWIQVARGVFAAVVGMMMVYQTVLVYRLQKGHEGDNPGPDRIRK